MGDPYKFSRRPVMASGLFLRPRKEGTHEAPVTLRMEGFGRKDANGDFDFTEDLLHGVFPRHGTTDGGVMILPPERKTPGSLAPSSISYFAVAGGAAFGAGVPNVDTGDLETGYSWLADTGGELLFRGHSASGATVDRVMFDSFGDIWFESDSGFWGTLTHQNTDDRVWTFPDKSGTVALVGDPIYAPIKTVSADYTASGTDHTILCNASGASFTVTLPPAADVEGLILVVKKIAPVAAANTVTIDGDGAETIDDAANQVISKRYDSLTIQSDGTEWWIL